jgi:hypothetical protein
MKKRINHKNIAEMMKDQGLTYDEVQELSNGKISSDMLKKRLKHGGYFKDEQIRILIRILCCSENDVVDSSERITDNLPPFINQMISRLYYSLKNSHKIVYQYYTKIKLCSDSFRNRFGQANRLLNEIIAYDDLYCPDATTRALQLILDCFKNENVLSDFWNGLSSNEAKQLFLMIEASEQYSQEQRLLLLFFYSHIIFYAIFLDDLLASILSHNIERKNKTYLAYKDRAIRNEILYLTLKKNILFSNTGLPEINSDPVMNMKQHLVDSILLMLCACKKTGEVLTSDYRNSLCLDDSEFDAILTHLETTFENLGIKTIVYTQFQYMQSPFYFAFEGIQKEYMAKKEERKIAEEKRKTEQEITKQIIIIAQKNI